MTTRIKIAMDNDAFYDGPAGSELARILRHLADKVEELQRDEELSLPIMDLNGNRVGTLEIESYLDTLLVW